jgi:hypothetical protein
MKDGRFWVFLDPAIPYPSISLILGWYRLIVALLLPLKSFRGLRVLMPKVPNDSL